MRVKLSTPDVGLSNEDISTSRAELLDAYNEVLEQGINLNYASALVDNMLVGLDIVRKYNNSKDATAALESLQKIVSKSPVEITASCEGVGEALKAAWDKFIEICKTIWEKMKILFKKLKEWMLGSNKTNMSKTRQLQSRVDTSIPSGNSKPKAKDASIDDDVIDPICSKLALKFAKAVQSVITSYHKSLTHLKSALTRDSAGFADQEVYRACKCTRGLGLSGSDPREVGMVFKTYEIGVIERYNLQYFDRIISPDEKLDTAAPPKLYNNVRTTIGRWNRDNVTSFIKEVEQFGSISNTIATDQTVNAIIKLSTGDEIYSKLNQLFNDSTIKPQTAYQNEYSREKMQSACKECVNAMNIIGRSASKLIAELPKMHSYLNREIEKVMNALGY